MGLTIQETLERIRVEAVRKARQGIADKRVKAKSDPVEDALRKLQSGIGPVAKEVSSKVCRRIVDRFLTTFQDSLSEMKEELTSGSAFPTAARKPDGQEVVYPEGCRFMYTDNNGQGTVVIEQQPQVRTILVGSGQRKHVPLPYVVFVITFRGQGGQFHYSGLNVGFRTEPVRSLDDYLCNPHLPNFGGHNVCMGSYTGPPRAGSPSEVAEDVIGTFWQSVFGQDFNRFKLSGKSISTWRAWEDIGKDNPLAILKAKFEQGNRIRDLIRYNDASISTADSHKLGKLVQKTWNKVASELTTDEAQSLVQGASEEILNQLLRDLALQPQ